MFIKPEKERRFFYDEHWSKLYLYISKCLLCSRFENKEDLVHSIDWFNNVSFVEINEKSIKFIPEEDQEKIGEAKKLYLKYFGKLIEKEEIKNIEYSFKICVCPQCLFGGIVDREKLNTLEKEIKDLKKGHDRLTDILSEHFQLHLDKGLAAVDPSRNPTQCNHNQDIMEIKRFIINGEALLKICFEKIEALESKQEGKNDR